MTSTKRQQGASRRREVVWRGLTASYTPEEEALAKRLSRREAWLVHELKARLGATPEYPFVFAWGNNAKRATLKGRRCRILERGRMASVLIELEDGSREIVSWRALRDTRKT